MKTKKITHVCGVIEASEPLNKLINPSYKLPKLKEGYCCIAKQREAEEE